MADLSCALLSEAASTSSLPDDRNEAITLCRKKLLTASSTRERRIYLQRLLSLTGQLTLEHRGVHR